MKQRMERKSKESCPSSDNSFEISLHGKKIRKNARIIFQSKIFVFYYCILFEST